jgi:tetratricopeptide (TPR) repeat protein
MSAPQWKNLYDLTDQQITSLGDAEDKMELMQITEAEEILNKMIQQDKFCIPVLNTLGHLNGRYLSDFEKAIEYYEMVLKLEPDNSWARDERRRYRRYATYE